MRNPLAEALTAIAAAVAPDTGGPVFGIGFTKDGETTVLVGGVRREVMTLGAFHARYVVRGVVTALIDGSSAWESPLARGLR
jgi:uncharacterized protein YaiE (UPF0345 family)